MRLLSPEERALPELDRLTLAYRRLLRQYQAHAAHEIEILRALDDREALIKEEIKHGMLKAAEGMFAHTYWEVTGRRLSDDTDAG